MTPLPCAWRGLWRAALCLCLLCWQTLAPAAVLLDRAEGRGQPVGAQALHWVDIEDEGLDADELGITAFPSVAICRPAGVLRYLGPVRADREGFLAAVAQLHRLPPRAIPEPLRAVLPAAR